MSMVKLLVSIRYLYEGGIKDEYNCLRVKRT